MLETPNTCKSWEDLDLLPLWVGKSLRKDLSAGTILTTSVKTDTKNITLVAAHPSVSIKPDLFAKRN
ncbi:hypothetical protein [Nostoc sp. DedQUE09]|uniref:hypothetical protein n=1 Tax=Nostoc sp. DedQUE09 TaxID=3075394 RepID=UPI002AD3D9E6|nr:hypothetical protein [Nostoc sp. DedQUE09]